MAWVVNSANGSVAAAALVHGWFGVNLSMVSFLPSEDIVPLDSDLLTKMVDFSLMGAYIFMALMYWVVAFLLILNTKGKLGYKKPAEN